MDKDTDPTISLFNGATNVVNCNSTLNINSIGLEAGISRLENCATLDAIHNAAGSGPKVHPKTRKTILDSITNWIKNPDPEHYVLWLNAPFGHGKTAVMQNIAASLHRSSLSDYAGSFFFSRGKPGRDRAQNLIPTLAYQIALNIPGMRQQINQAMIHDISLPFKNMETQLQSLILDPFRRCSPPLSNKPVVIIDALDECIGLTTAELPFNEDAKHDASLKAQYSILDVVVQAVSSPHCPLRFLISSRPEYDLRVAFRGQELCQISQHIELDGDKTCCTGGTSLESKGEMMVYLRDRFNAIYRNHPTVFNAKPWPSNDFLWELVERASGQYLFTEHVLKLSSRASRTYSPRAVLNVILKPGDFAVQNPFLTMDNLYMQILIRCPGKREHLQWILNICACLYPWRPLPQSTFAELSNSYKVEDLVMLFYGLNALFDLDDGKDISNLSRLMRMRDYSPLVHFWHRSFIDFLSDQKRSGEFHVDIDAVRNQLMARADALLADGLSGCQKSLLHEKTLDMITTLAKMDIADNGNGKKILHHFPLLQKIMQNDLIVPDKPGTRFVESIYIVLNIFQFPMRKNLLDEVWRKIDSHSLYFSPILHTILMDNDMSPSISKICDALGRPLCWTYHVLHQLGCFRVKGQGSNVQALDFSVQLLDDFRSFAESQSRSGSLYFVYRDCWIRAILVHWKELLTEYPKFTLNTPGFRRLVEGFFENSTFSDINFSYDLQDKTAMNDLIDFVLEIAERGASATGKRTYGVGIVYLFSKWLVWQQEKISRYANEKYNCIAIKLQAIGNKLDWNSLISEVFSIHLLYHPSETVPPFGIKRIDYAKETSRWAVKFYPFILVLAGSNRSLLLFGEDIISTISHTTICEFFLHAMFARERHSTAENDWQDWQDHCVPILTQDVRWHYHLRYAAFSETILCRILTVDHLLRNSMANEEQLAFDTIVNNASSFANGVVAWLKNHTLNSSDLEWWRKGILGIEHVSEITPSSKIRQSFGVDDMGLGSEASYTGNMDSEPIDKAGTSFGDKGMGVETGATLDSHSESVETEATLDSHSESARELEWTLKRRLRSVKRRLKHAFTWTLRRRLRHPFTGALRQRLRHPFTWIQSRLRHPLMQMSVLRQILNQRYPSTRPGLLQLSQYVL